MSDEQIDGYLRERDAQVCSRKRTGRSIVITITSLALLLGTVGCRGRLGRAESPVDLYVDAVTLQDQNRSAEAIEKLNTAIEKNKNFSQAYSLRGDIYQQTKQYEKSAASYDTATRLNPWSFHDFFNLGKVYQIMTRLAEAVKAYVRACELKPDHLQAHVNTAMCYRELEEYDSALIYGQRAEQIDANTVQVQELLGDIYESMKDHDQAIRYYKRAIEVDSNDTQIMTSLAVAYLRTQRDEPAKELLESVVEIDPQYGKAYKYLGYCYLRLYEKGAAAYTEAVSRGTEDKVELEALRQNATKMVERSVENYERAIAIDEQDWDAHRGLGVAYIIQGKAEGDTVDEQLKEKAISHWRTSLQINPDQPRGDRLRQLIAKYRRK